MAMESLDRHSTSIDTDTEWYPVQINEDLKNQKKKTKQDQWNYNPWKTSINDNRILSRTKERSLAKDITKYVATGLYASYFTSLFHILSHETGHGIWFFLSRLPFQMHIGYDLSGYVRPLDHPKLGQFIKSWKYPLMVASGPIAGTLSTLAALKISNIYGEYKESKDIKYAIKESSKKPLINLDQNLIFLYFSLLDLLLRSPGNFIKNPEGTLLSDGSQICNWFNLGKNAGKLARFTMAGGLSTMTGAYLVADYLKKSQQKTKEDDILGFLKYINKKC